MLAVRHAPRMGSTQPESDPLLMFGYSTQPDIFDAAPDPAPGAPLLTETDSKFLSSFFEDMTSNQYNMPSFGEGLNFSDAWLDLPPQFMGSSTSLGPQETSADFGFSSDHQNELSRILSADSSMMPPPPPPAPSHTQTFSQQHSDDVLNAAATLLQNGNRAGTPKSGSSPGNSSNSGSTANRPLVYPVGHLRHQPMEEFTEENQRVARRSSQGNELDHTFTRWMWGSKEKTAVPKPVLGDFQWGSDASFSDVQGYVPEPRKESVESMHQTQMKCLECLEVNQSAANTRPGSPANGQAASSNGDGPVYIKREEDPNAPPRKRRKSKNVRGTAVDEDDDDDDDDTSSKSGRKRKTKSERSASGSEPPSDTTAGSRRRKSGVNGSKPPRENLSEEQKRENHIRSEQKRRTLIKEGFDDLGELVPGLKGGGFSKSTTLAMAAEWLDELLRGNKALAMQVSALEQR
ncbi:bHLH family transcription factor [Metarhizium acridum CQMa 102]|uniref:BHLH family transcription factor n=1 Tax=Metarhizium acridum (strain CQMa 102) TaxID=655827 RepID=E9E9I9_METAQ|nr:bHLH family transcription factor [Metarhizium acridum CQMa 102]EFY87429.1 bHLH family transcription factor [Metarhizium acridum CQMa 102]